MKKLLTLLLAVLLLAGCAGNKPGTFEAGKNTFLLNGKPFVVKAAEVHYPRIPREYWEHRIEMCKALGMNTLCLYAIPYELYKKYGVRRYGFHGTSHRYVSQRVCEFLGVNPEGKKIITCHIGNGGSITAVKDGKSIDTSMGLTPLEGLMMGTRSGDIDAGAVTFIMEKENLSASGVSDLLNKKSGVKGIFGVSSDMRELEAAVAAGNNKMADLTEKMYFYRIKKYIGAYAAALGGVDIIVFTGCVGENQASCRSGACEGLEYMGVKLDLEKNKIRGEEAVISAEDSKVKVVVIPTDEELMIASDTMAILNKK